MMQCLLVPFLWLCLNTSRSLLICDVDFQLNHSFRNTKDHRNSMKSVLHQRGHLQNRNQLTKWILKMWYCSFYKEMRSIKRGQGQQQNEGPRTLRVCSLRDGKSPAWICLSFWKLHQGDMLTLTVPRNSISSGLCGGSAGEQLTVTLEWRPMRMRFMEWQLLPIEAILLKCFLYFLFVLITRLRNLEEQWNFANS